MKKLLLTLFAATVLCTAINAEISNTEKGENKMNTIIVYSSTTGFTKQYAQWISEETGFEAVELKSAKPEQIQKNELSIDLFKKIVCNYEFADSPERVQKLLAQIPQKFALNLFYSSEQTGTPINYVRTGESPFVFKGNVKDFGTCIMALFEDGTTYFSGALQNSQILRTGKPVAFRLPKLPQRKSSASQFRSEYGSVKKNTTA